MNFHVHSITLPLKDIRAVLFDMDGTMVDNMGYHKIAWITYFRQKGIPISDEEFKTKISGSYNAKIFKRFLKKSLIPEEVYAYGEEKEDLYRRLYVKHLKPVKGLLEIIHVLKGKHMLLGLATTSPLSNRQFILRKLKLENTFDVVVGMEDIHHGKPDPEIYITTAKKLGVDPETCLVFEDSPAGVSAAKAAGMHVVGVTTSHTKEELSQADYTVENFLQVHLV